jgi:hypothetical protein
MPHQSKRRPNEYADGMIEHDNDVGKLLKLLDDLKIADNTIVIYTTDNGPNRWSWPDAATSPFSSAICTISTPRRCPEQPAWPKDEKIRHPPFALASFWLWTVTANMFRWFLVGLEPPHRLFTQLMTIVAVTPIVLVAYFGCPWGDLRCVLIAALAAAPVIFFVYEHQSESRALLIIPYVVGLLVGTLIFVLSNIAALFGEPYQWPPHAGYYFLAGFVVLFALSFAAEQSILDVKRLYRRISLLSSKTTLRIPTYVTTAVGEKQFAGTIALPTQSAEKVRMRTVTFRHVFVPDYHRIDTERGSRRTRKILASASIPWGVFSPICIDGVRHVDGGAAGDVANTPVKPVADYDEIWVVRLRSGP